MKLGESGEAFFVEECPEDLEELPENLATSPIPTNEFAKFDENKTFVNASEDIQLPLPIPRRNSIDLSKECNDDTTEKKFENQISDFSQRRHTDNTMERRDLVTNKKEYTTQKIRQEWAEHEDQLVFQLDWNSSTLKTEETNNEIEQTTNVVQVKTKEDTKIAIKEESKSKKKRRKKSQMKKKNAQRKSSSSSSLGSVQLETNEQEPDTVSLSNQTNSSNDESSSKVDEASSKSDSKTEETIIEDKKGNINTNNNNINKEIVTATSRIRDLDIHFFSDTEIASGLSPRVSRPSTPVQSDSELEITQREKGTNTDMMTNSASWKWGELPTQCEEIQDIPDQKQAQRNSMLSGMFSFMKKTNKLRKNATEGVYLSDLDPEGMDPEMAALYFPPINKETSLGNNDDDRESGNGTSLPHSPSSIEGPKSLDSDYDDGKSSDKYLDFVSMSLCGGLEKGGPTDEEFNCHVVKYTEVCKNPAIFSSPNLVVRLNGKYYSWSAACPIVMTIITFQKPLSNDAIEKLIKSTIYEEETVNKIDAITSTSPPIQETKRGYSWWYWRRSGGEKQPDSKEDTKIDNDSNAVATQTSRSCSPAHQIESKAVKGIDEKLEQQQNNSDASDLLNVDNTSQINISKNEKYRKSLRLSSDQIKSLNLKSGMNEVAFSVTTAYQGTSRCKCYLFRWKHSDKVVISDIDGTITKSDVLGHILPMVGKDWAQIGVAQLFSKIEENGYKLLYLSARAIGQSRATREYLRSIRQGDVKLPDGPLLLNPTSLISALHREVIERKPEQFKIACLSDIQALFPDKNPFYAGYGNRINDVWAYRAVGIPIMRIFTINTKGELKHELTQTFQSSYCSMTYIVDQLFPPIKDDEDSVEFSSFNYWRDPVTDFDLELDVVGGANTTFVTAQPALQTAGTPTKSLATIPEN